jgi:hypothetical protein
MREGVDGGLIGCDECICVGGFAACSVFSAQPQPLCTAHFPRSYVRED